MSAKAATPAPAAAKPVSSGNDLPLELGGGAVLLLALGGAAYAVSRRRRQVDEEEWYGDEMTDHEYVQPAVAAETVEEHPLGEPRHDEFVGHQPPLVAPAASAFGWGNETPADEEQVELAGDDREPGETWAERAYRGPSPSNPSLSLKKRLKRAAFFDKRERLAAEGRAAPIEADAGLPDSARVEERELVDA